MNTSQDIEKSVAQISCFIVVANIYLSKKTRTLKVLNLNGKPYGIFRRNEIHDLLAGKLDRVNIVLFRNEPNEEKQQ